jgi:hypothetical protein
MQLLPSLRMSLIALLSERTEFLGPGFRRGLFHVPRRSFAPTTYPPCRAIPVAFSLRILILSCRPDMPYG